MVTPRGHREREAEKWLYGQRLLGSVFFVVNLFFTISRALFLTIDNCRRHHCVGDTRKWHHFVEGTHKSMSSCKVIFGEPEGVAASKGPRRPAKSSSGSLTWSKPRKVRQTWNNHPLWLEFPNVERTKMPLFRRNVSTISAMPVFSRNVSTISP